MNCKFMGDIPTAIQYLNSFYPDRTEPHSDRAIQALSIIIDNLRLKYPKLSEQWIKNESFTVFRDYLRSGSGAVPTAIRSTVQQAEAQQQAQAKSMYQATQPDLSEMQLLINDLIKYSPYMAAAAGLLLLAKRKKKNKRKKKK